MRPLEVLMSSLQFVEICPAMEELLQRTAIVHLADLLPPGRRRPVLIAPTARTRLLHHLHQRANLDESPEQPPYLFGLVEQQSPE